MLDYRNDCGLLHGEDSHSASAAAPKVETHAEPVLFGATVRAVIRKIATSAALAVIVLGSPRAHADAATLAKLTSLGAEAESAPDARAYAALRKLWSEWDRGEPSEVEEELAQVARSRHGSTRVYAELLGAYARRRRGDLDGARARIASLGFVSKWLVAGSFDNEGKTGLARPFEPEVEDAPNAATAFDGKERKVTWRAPPLNASFGWVDANALVRPTENVCMYATTFVSDPSLKAGQTRLASVWAGTSGAMKIFWNGTLALEDAKYRDFDPERMGRTVTLAAGWNRVLVKACGSESAPIFTVRIAAADGSPDARIQTSNDFSHAADVRALFQKQKLPPNGVAGPIQAFAGNEKSADPAVLEAYARYLVVTQSDDEADHLARDMALRAAQRAPTVQRALLAAGLVESRNQSADWIAKAEEIVARGGASADDKMDALLARAGHERTGTNWRDAVPYYDRALAIDPDNVPAIAARVELYGEANLRATALAFLERAVARRPRSVALVRATVDLLRQEDRTTEADEMEARYTALRFDDPELLRAKIDLAIARRDATTASHWIDRLVATDPDATDKLVLAAAAHEKLGDVPHAIALYKRALALAPEDTDTMQKLADTYGSYGDQNEQVTLLRHIVELKPQSKNVRDYLAHLEPTKPKPDEVYAVASKDFLAHRNAPAGGYDQRTIVDLTVATVFENGLSSKFHQVVFQPLTDPAAQSARNYVFGYESDSQTVQIRGVHVYRVDGTVDDSFDTAVGGANDPSIATYTSESSFSVRFPRLSAGDVVELRYRIEDVAERNAFADYFGDIDYLQSTEPVALGEYVLIGPKRRTFYFNKPTIPVTQTTEEKGDQRVYRIVATNIPPLLPEPQEPPLAELAAHIHVSTYKSWDEMGAWYWGLVKDQFVADDEVRRRVQEITKGKTTPRDKVNAIYDYVVEKTRYVALEFGIHGFKPYRCSQIFARGFGDCKDKATLIVTMLGELGIPATIVIVRTGTKGNFEDYPASLAPFDHAIAYVPSLDLYLDGTAEYSGSNDFPAMDRGALALQVNQGKPKLVHLPDPPATASVTTRKMEAVLSADGTAQIDWRATVTGVNAPSWRVRYHAESLRKDRLQEDLASDLPGASLTSVDAGDLENVEAPAQIHARGRVPAFARRDQDTLDVPVGPRETMVRSYASVSQRHADVRLSAQTTNETEYTIKIPAGSKISAMPGTTTLPSPFGNFSLAVDPIAGGVHVKTTIVISKTRIAVAEYAAFRKWCEAIDSALAQRLVVTLGGH
jgi:transglutaminase-like putative cysteine protease/tetratricopeptide (TPR) repeat protein